MSITFLDQRTEHFGYPGFESSDFNVSVAAAFEQVAAKFPSRIAISSEVWQPTYRELNERANRLAHRVMNFGVGLGNRAAILMFHEAPMYAAVLGLAKAGQIVVALDPGDPLSRLKVLVQDTEPLVIVADEANLSLAADIAAPGCKILKFELETASGPIDNPSLDIRPDQTAILIYTSGSTGRPKGVMRTHQQLCRNVAVRTEAMQSTENDRIAHFASISTGQGMSFLWWILLNGATVCPFPVKTRGVTGLADWIVACGLTVYASSASIFRTLVKTLDDGVVFSNLRLVWLGSEGVAAADFRAFQKHFPSNSVLVHSYSSSENSIIAWARWKRSDVVPDGLLPVGHFARDLEVSLIGDDGQKVPNGEIGEIVVKNRFMVGYWRDPSLTAERFSIDLDGKGTRLVRTGDLGRINDDGLLELHGRKDDRVKVRGNRIELGEIDRALETVPGIEKAAAVAVSRKFLEPMLVAFVVRTADASWTTAQLRLTLKEILPIHMIPSRIVFLDSLPYNRGNKVDREALRHYASPSDNENKSEEPQTETELLLADLWSESLDRVNVSRDDDFFELGGDSLKGAVVAAQIHAALRVELSLGTIADYPTLSALAAYIDTCQRAVATNLPPIVPVARAASMPVSAIQEYWWPYRGSPALTVVQKSRIRGPLDVRLYKECLSYLTDRHEILRTTFGVVDGRPAQIIHPSSPLSFEVIDLVTDADPEGAADAFFHELASQPIDVERLPIMRRVLIKIADNEHRLARLVSAMISDGFSSRMLDRELATLYEARVQGREPPLARQAALQFADYAVWQREATRPDNRYFQELANWWTGTFSIAPPITQLPLRRLITRAKPPAEGVLGWMLEEHTATRLDEIARKAGTTPFIIRLAAFAALLAGVTGKSTVTLKTQFDNRNRAESQTIAGPFVNTIPLVFSFDASKTFMRWLKIVHDRVFETLAHSELPFEKIQEQLRATGVNPPQSDVMFMLSRDNSDQSFGNLGVSSKAFIPGSMPMGCAVYVDAQKSENCQILFDAAIYRRKDIDALLRLYLRLLASVAAGPTLPIGKLLIIAGSKQLRWVSRKYTAPIYDFFRCIYNALPLLKRVWKPVKRRFLPNGDSYRCKPRSS